MEEELVAEGNWCLVCGFLEDAEDIQDGKCMSCGCEEGMHQKVKVVAA